MNTTCACHAGGAYGVCDYPGGCGSTGGCCSSRPAPTRTAATNPSRAVSTPEPPSEVPVERRRPRAGDCVTCLVLRPDSDPRQPHNPPVCDGDRTLLDKWLGEITRLHDQLTEPEQPIINQRTYERFGIQDGKNNQRQIVSLGQAWADPTAAVGGVAPINSRSKAPTVSGSRERPIPIRADLHDITAPLRGANLTDAGRQHPDDHVGHLPAATVLDGWVRSWRDTLWPGQHLPAGTVPELIKWLRVRLEDACDRYPIIDEFTAEIRDLRGTLRAMAGESDPPPVSCDGIQCDRCDMRALFRRPEDTYQAECGNCGKLYTVEEYETLTGGQADYERFTRSPEEIAAFMRR